MPDDLLAPEDEGAFSWLSRPRRVVLNSLRGEYGMALDQALDFVLNIPDAALPGDVIPEMSGPGSDIEVGDLYDMKPGFAKTAVDIVGGIPLDPLTYVPFGKVAQQVAKPAASAAKAVGVAKPLRKVRNLAADTMNWHQLTPEQRAMEMKAKSTGSIAGRAAETEAERIAKMVTPQEGEAVIDAIQNVGKNAKGEWYVLDEMRTIEPRLLAENEDAAVRALRLTDTFIKSPPDRQERLIEATKEAVRLGQTEADEAFMAGGKSDRPYAMAQYEFEDAPDVVATATRGLTPQDMAAKFNADPALAGAYSRDLGSSLLKRAGQQGKIMTRKTLGDDLWRGVKATLPDDSPLKTASFDLTDKAHTDAVVAHLNGMVKADGPERDFAVRALAMFKGMDKLDPFSDAMAKFNANIFKPAATVGVVIPRVSFTVRNSLSAIAQALSTPGARGAALRDPKWIYQRIVGGLTDPIEEFATKIAGKPIRIGDDTNRLLALTEEAFTNAKGSVTQAKNYLRNNTDPLAKEALEALEQNVLENPIKVDEVISSLRPDNPMWRKLKDNVYDLPGQLNKHVEDRIRAGLFLAAKRSGQSPVAASASVRNAVLDYSVPTIENRRMRTWIPFGAFMSQTLPQSAKLLMENAPEGFARGGVQGAISSGLAGGAARGAANAMFETDPENPIYPDMEGKLAIPAEGAAPGMQRYLTSFGLPLEGLGDIPMSTDQRDLERFVGVAANPLVKTAYSAVTGREPFFGTPYGGYDKPYAALEAMGMESGPLAAGIRKATGTGMLQPLTHALNLADPWMDDRQGTALDLVRAGTGVRVRDIDEDMALRLNLEEALRQNPRVKQYSGFYKGSEDEDTNELMESYNAAKRRIADKRKAAKEEAAATVQ